MEGELNIKRELCSGIDLERENRILRESLLNLKKEISKFNEKPLIVCEVKSVLGNKAMIKLPNGNNFVVNISNHLLNKILPCDVVLSEQRSLTIVDRLEKTKSHNVEDFLIVKNLT